VPQVIIKRIDHVNTENQVFPQRALCWAPPTPRHQTFFADLWTGAWDLQESGGTARNPKFSEYFQGSACCRAASAPFFTHVQI
jgi:hypothetical protein